MQKVVAITFYGRSGSVFLQSLFDGHPDCIQVPGTYLMALADWFQGVSAMSTPQLVDEFCNTYRVLFDAGTPNPIPGPGGNAGRNLGLTTLGVNRDNCAEISEHDFRASLMRRLGSSRPNLPDLFLALHFAYAEALGQTTSSKTQIVYQLHHPTIQRAQFLSHFDLKVLRMVRDPVQTSMSHLRHYLKQGYVVKEDSLPLVVDTLMSYGALPGFHDKTRAIKLEDLHAEPESILRRICDWIGLDWDPCLLTSTFNGEKWWNVADAAPVNGFNNFVTGVGAPQISSSDRRRLETLGRRAYRAWQYPRSGTSINWFAKFDMESEISPARRALTRLKIIKRVVRSRRSTGDNWLRPKHTPEKLLER